MHCSASGCYETVVHSVEGKLESGLNVAVLLCCIHRIVELLADERRAGYAYASVDVQVGLPHCYYHPSVKLPVGLLPID